MIYAVILAGGSGTRLWPLSRSLSPKHLLPPLGGDKSLFQQTALRLLKSVAPERILTVTHEDHRFEILRQLQEIVTPAIEGVLAEPVANNTLPAISWAVMQIANRDPEGIIGVFPSDHLLEDDKGFQESFQKAIQVANQGYLVTFGIPVAGPETGYGYIQTGPSLNGSGDHAGAFRVLSFVEKPDRETALSYMKQGNYYWNSGMFVFRVRDFLAELKKHEPEIARITAQITASRNEPSQLKTLYPTLKKISIDHGIMEKAEKVAVVPSNFRWSDLGSWEAIYHALDKDSRQNAVQGDVLSYDTTSSLLISKKGLVATIGLSDAVVIQTDDAVLVSPRNRVQDVKKIVDLLKERKSQLAEAHSTVARPWGLYTVLEEGIGYKIKRITVSPGHKLSLQSHRRRAEHWVVIEGTARITNGNREIFLKENESTFIPMGSKHRLENPGVTPLTIIEVQTGSYLGEDDIERFDDVYGRVEVKK